MQGKSNALWPGNENGKQALWPGNENGKQYVLNKLVNQLGNCGPKLLYCAIGNVMLITVATL